LTVNEKDSDHAPLSEFKKIFLLVKLRSNSGNHLKKSKYLKKYLKKIFKSQLRNGSSNDIGQLEKTLGEKRENSGLIHLF
jgi:hypothetical protein